MTRTEKLTNTTVARLAYAHQQQFYIVRDTEVGGFHIRVTATSKVYKYNCDVTEAGKRVTRGFTIGTSAAMTADAARLEAEKLVIQRKQGVLPKLTISALSPAKTGLTLGEAWVQFKDASIKEGKKPRTIAFYELVMRTHLKPWLDTPLKNITRSMVKELHGKISEKHRARANQVIVTGGAVYTFARADLEEADLPLLSPWRGRKLFNKIKPRQTGLAAASLPDWWCKVDRLNAVLREANLLGILTGLRKENLIALRWDQVNIKYRYISIDPESMKSGEPFKLPMSRAMVRCLWRARKGSRMLHELNSRTWVFASDRSRSGHISNTKNVQSWTRADGTKLKKVRVEQSAHALRHSWRDFANEARVWPIHSKVLMHHAVGSDVHSEYLTLGNMFDDLRTSQETVSSFIVKNIAPAEEARRGLM